MLLMKTALWRTSTLPIRPAVAQRAIAELRETFRKTVNDAEWAMLASVYRTKQMPNDDAYRKLLFNRCILEYHPLDADSGQKLQPWQDVHPLICDLENFQAALTALTASQDCEQEVSP